MATHKLQPEAIVHIGLIVKDADKVIDTWERVYGIGPWTVRELGATEAEGRPRARLCFANVGSVQFELIEPGEHPALAFHSHVLDTQGEGLHHVAFFVDDVDGEVSNLVAQGAELMVGAPGSYAYLGTGPGGAIFELMQRRA